MSECNCKKDKCLSPAVLQINNHDCPTVFHKVTFPAAMGDDETNPPRNGQYRNVLLVYEANGHVYMFSSDGIPTLISDGSRGIDDYNELTNKPSIEGHELVGESSLEDIGVMDAIEEALEDYTPTSDLAEVAFSGDYDDLENAPTPPVTHFYRPVGAGVDIPTPLFHNPDLSDQVTYQQFEDAILGGPVQIIVESGMVMTYAVRAVDIADIVVGSRMTFYTTRNTFREVFQWESSEDAPIYVGDAPYDIQSNWSETDPSSPDYIRNKPTIPTVNNATLTIQKEGSSIGTFTANSDTDTTVNVVETDPTVPSWAKQPTKPTYSYSEITDKPTIPAAQVNSDWNANSGVAEILNKPTIPTVNNATLTITQNGTSAGTFTANASSDTTISLTDTTYSDFSGATSSAAGAHGLVPAPSAGDEGKVLHGDGTWKDATAKLVEMSYGESNAWAKFIAAYQAGSIVYCRASSNANPATGSQTRKAFMAYVNNAEGPTSVEFQYVRSVSSKTASQPVDQVFVYTLTNASGGTWTVASRNMAPKLAAGTNTTVNYSNGTYTVNATVPTPTVFNMTYDTTATTWTDTDIGITLQETPYGTFPDVRERIQTFAVPTPVFTNASTGSTLDAEGLYSLLETGADVVLNGVPIGVRLRRVNGAATFTVGGIVCDGVRLTKVGPFHIEDFDPDTSELVYSMDLSSYSATVSANAVGTTMPTLLPFAIRVYKRVTFDSEVSPDPQTEYAFEIQGTSHNHTDAPT